MENQFFMLLVEKIYPSWGSSAHSSDEILKTVMELAESLNVNTEASLKFFRDNLPVVS
jgi:tRNA(Ser,Leu) C12 N-acetylase TAN1